MGKRIFDRWFEDKLFPVEIDRDAMLGIGADLDQDAGDVSSNIGLIAELVGDYVRRYGHAEAAYRHWRAGLYLKLKIVEGKLPSDELVKHQVEADPAFLGHKSEMAELEGDIEYLRGLFDALRTKATMVRARTDMARGKFDGEGIGFDLREKRVVEIKTAMKKETK